MSQKVVSLRDGTEVFIPFEVCAKAVSEAERLLEAARAGEIQGFVAFMTHGDGAVSYTDSDPAPTYSLVGKMLQVANWMADKAGNR